MKILLAVDGSSYTKKMLAYLSTHDELFGAAANDYTVITVQPPLPPRARAAVGKDVMDGYYSEEAEKIMAPVSKFLTRHGIDAKSCWKVGPAGETIAKFADAGKFDLLIMGSHGHNALTNLVMGSVATKVLANGKVPVLLVR
ncbi:MAG: universal stress protein [Polaromonas sp.]|nr:universal stress protein [Polaromonas sp.]